uniref:Uncharacterized protein n=1 Tax=Solanum lycopersicum TaxID=4081 RepID=A0A3Q7GW32_SOLLC
MKYFGTHTSLVHDAEKWKLKNYCGINSKRDEASLIKHQAKTTSLLAIKLPEVTEDFLSTKVMCPARMIYKESIKARASHTITQCYSQLFFNILIYNVDYMKTEALSHTYLRTSLLECYL